MPLNRKPGKYLLPPQGFGAEAKTRGGIIDSPAYTYKDKRPPEDTPVSGTGTYSATRETNQTG